MTDKQQAALDFIRTYTTEHGYPPSLREIMAGTGITSTSVAAYQLSRLERLGYITVTPNVARGIRLNSIPRNGGNGNTEFAAVEK